MLSSNRGRTGGNTSDQSMHKRADFLGLLVDWFVCLLGCLFLFFFCSLFKPSYGQFYWRKILHDLIFTSLFWHASKDTIITWISDSQCAYSVVFSMRCAPFNIFATVVMYTRLGQHGIVLFQIFSTLGSCWQGWPVSLCLVWSCSESLYPST